MANDEHTLRARQAQKIILNHPDTLGKQFLLKMLAKRQEKAQSTEGGNIIPSTGRSKLREPASGLYEPVEAMPKPDEPYEPYVPDSPDEPDWSDVPYEPDEPDEPDWPEGYERNPDWVGDNPEKPTDDILF